MVTCLHTETFCQNHLKCSKCMLEIWLWSVKTALNQDIFKLAVAAAYSFENFIHIFIVYENNKYTVSIYTMLGFYSVSDKDSTLWPMQTSVTLVLVLSSTSCLTLLSSPCWAPAAPSWVWMRWGRGPRWRARSERDSIALCRCLGENASDAGCPHLN